MTDIELKEAKDLYKKHLRGKEQVLECLANGYSNYFLHKFANTNRDKIAAIEDDEILRNTFLSVFQHEQPEEKNHFYVYINIIERVNDRIDDGQPELVAFDFVNASKQANYYNLYCDLENNIPVLKDYYNEMKFKTYNRIIFLPVYVAKRETYRYNSKSLEKITKGYATDAFNKLQLYYFKQLLETSREKANARMLSLTNQDYRDICL